MLNTPPCFSWYMAGLVFEWIEAHGGVPQMQALAHKRAALLYDTIDHSEMYRNPVTPEHRSLMNVPFILKNPALDEVFLAEAKAAGLQALAGHRSVGGMRASLYNAMPLSGVEALTSFMHFFEQKNSSN